jgi:hypothetical protein
MGVEQLFEEPIGQITIHDFSQLFRTQREIIVQDQHVGTVEDIALPRVAKKHKVFGNETVDQFHRRLKHLYRGHLLITRKLLGIEKK